jgi:hypothetical protein
MDVQVGIDGLVDSVEKAQEFLVPLPCAYSGRCRSRFRADGDHDSGETDQGSGGNAITVPG